MEILILAHDDVTALLPFAECIPLMRDALTALSRGDGTQPLRTIVRPDGISGMLGLMPGHVKLPGQAASGDQGVLGIKLLGIFGGNPALGKDAHQGVVLLLDPSTGEAKAVVNASAITAIRTAAVSAVATDVLAAPHASSLAVVGTGVQAQSHVAALVHIRPISRVRMAGRDEERGRAVAARLSAEHAIEVEFVPDVEAAVSGADVVVTATTSATPVIRRAWLAEGAHINAVGAAVPDARELDTETVADSAFYVDRRESALAESGDFRLAAADCGFGPEHIRGELGEVLSGDVEGRRSAAELTIFESLGLAVEDLAAAAYVCETAARTGNGTWVRF